MKGQTKHGHCVGGKVSPTYESWGSMLNRCKNKGNHAFNDYGGRGITVCEDWCTFEGFLKDMGVKPHGSMLERIDNDKGYYKENCRWATREEQNRNKRNTIWLTHDGKTLCASDWARVTDIPRQTILRRYKSKWEVKRLLTLKPEMGRNQFTPPKFHRESGID